MQSMNNSQKRGWNSSWRPGLASEDGIGQGEAGMTANKPHPLSLQVGRSTMQQQLATCDARGRTPLGLPPLNARTPMATIAGNAFRDTHLWREMHCQPRERKGSNPAPNLRKPTLPNGAPQARGRLSFNTVQDPVPDFNIKDNAGEGPSIGKKNPC
jgi:hypothetical protein